MQKYGNQSGGGIFLLRADVFADQRFCALCLHSGGSVLLGFVCFVLFFFQLPAAFKGLQSLCNNEERGHLLK